jgi:hypothetical protein
MDLKEKCLDCFTERQYNEHFDAHFCRDCDKWLEEKCGDEECEYCWGRPPKPSNCQPVQELGEKSLDRKL